MAEDIKVYVSHLNCNNVIRKKQLFVINMLEAFKINFETIDISTPGSEDQKKYMLTNAVPETGCKIPHAPQIFNKDEYCGDYIGLAESIEANEFYQFLKLAPPKPQIIQQYNDAKDLGTNETKEDDKDTEKHTKDEEVDDVNGKKEHDDTTKIESDEKDFEDNHDESMVENNKHDVKDNDYLSDSKNNSADEKVDARKDIVKEVGVNEDEVADADDKKDATEEEHLKESDSMDGKEGSDDKVVDVSEHEVLKDFNIDGKEVGEKDINMKEADVDVESVNAVIHDEMMNGTNLSETNKVDVEETASDEVKDVSEVGYVGDDKVDKTAEADGDDEDDIKLDDDRMVKSEDVEDDREENRPKSVDEGGDESKDGKQITDATVRESESEITSKGDSKDQKNDGDDTKKSDQVENVDDEDDEKKKREERRAARRLKRQEEDKIKEPSGDEEENRKREERKARRERRKKELQQEFGE